MPEEFGRLPQKQEKHLLVSILNKSMKIQIQRILTFLISENRCRVSEPIEILASDLGN